MLIGWLYIINLYKWVVKCVDTEHWVTRVQYWMVKICEPLIPEDEWPETMWIAISGVWVARIYVSYYSPEGERQVDQQYWRHQYVLITSESQYPLVTQQYIPVLQVLVKYVFSTYLYRKYSWSTSRSSSGNTISISFTYSSLTATHIVWLSKISYSRIP